MLQQFNDILSFIIELISVYLYTYWAYNIPNTWFKKLLFGVLAFTIFALVWGMFFSPKARYPIPGLLGWILKFSALFMAFIPLAIERRIFVTSIAVVIIANLYLQTLK